MLGPLAVWTAEGTPVRVPEAKVRLLLARLLVDFNRPVPVDQLIEVLWGQRPPANPAAALQHKVWQLRRAIGAERVAAQPPGYLLRVEPQEVDAVRFLGFLEDEDLPAALALWRGPVLADFPDAEFTRGYGDGLTESRLRAKEMLARKRLAAGKPVLAELTPLVREHPLRERLRALHLRALYQEGRQAEALAGYAELRAQLAEELGVDPSPELAFLHQAMLRQDPALTRTATLALIGKLIGRDTELAELGALLRTERLVTLTGPGGVGKTSLALAAAADESFVDGARLVELAGHGPEVEQAVSAALGVRDDVPSADRLLDAVRGKRMLLVLDNCEHLLAPVAALVQRLLRAAPELRVLATSREGLGLSGETQYPVQPLRPEHAVALFAARAPGFRLTAENTPVVTAICAKLDGLPLAVELAATRVRVLGVDELAARLDDRFRLLTTGHRGAPARQQTLRAMIDWSWELLTAAEQLVLRRLAVHAEGCTLAAAEAICAGEGVRPNQVLDLLSRLIDRSLVAAGPRYRLLESVTAYGLEKLAEAGELDALRQRHREYYLALAEQAAPELHGEGQRCWLDGLYPELPNLHRALTGADADTALRLTGALAWYWFLRGRYTEAVRAFDQALATPGGDPALRQRVEAWRTGFRLLAGGSSRQLTGADSRTTWLLGHAMLGKGDPAISRQLNDTALAGFTESGDRWGEAAALSTRAAQSLLLGDLTGMRRDAERSAELFAEVGDRWGQVQASSELATVAEITGDYPAAARLHREGLRWAEELGLWTAVAAKLAGLGRIAMLTGDLAEAGELHRRAMAVAVQHGNTTGEHFAEVGLGLLARREGRLAEAQAHLSRWVDWCREVDGGPGLALVLTELGFIAEQRGDTAAALALHTESHEIACRTGDPRAIALTLEGLAGAHAAADPALAADLLARAAKTRAEVGAPLPAAERGDVARIERMIRAASR